MSKQEQGDNRGSPPRKPTGAGRVPALRPMRGFLAWMVILGLAMFMAHSVYNSGEKEKPLTYSQFLYYVNKGVVESCDVVVEPSSGRRYASGVLRDESGNQVRFTTDIPMDTQSTVAYLTEKQVDTTIRYEDPFWSQLLSNLLPIVLVFGLLYFLFLRQVRAAGHGAMSFGKSRARMLNRENKKILFSNVAGMDEAKEEVQEIVEYLKDPQRFTKLGGRIPKGVMLMGPPGTGKTLLAKAIAGEADVPFFSISGSDFVEMFVGVGASRVRDMFEQGKKSAPCIIFIDEIDAVGRSRFTGIGGGHDEREQTLNALLVEMDGFETQEGVIILAATNRPDVLDPALLRPGRFDRQIVIDLPMVNGRMEILKIHAAKIKLDTRVDFRKVARATPGFSGADLENMLNEAALLAARRRKDAVDMECLEEARDKVIWGRERRSKALGEKEKRDTATHEAGHAIVQVLVKDAEPLHKVTIIPRGMALGATMSLPEKDILCKTKSKLLAEVSICMGGRAAEMLLLGEPSTGARMDLKMATAIARSMVCDFGMSEALGPQAFGENQELMFLGREVSRSQNYSEETARTIDSEVSRILTEQATRAEQLLKSHQAQLLQVINRLMELETIDGRDVADILHSGRVRSQDERDVEDAARERESGGSATDASAANVGPGTDAAKTPRAGAGAP